MIMGFCPKCGNLNLWWDSELELWYCETDGCGFAETEAERLERELSDC